MYKVNEIFYSLQGEGAFTGTPMVFVRFSGCNRACSFCDTDFEQFTQMDVEGILTEAGRFPALHVVFTGGEPLLQLDEKLVDAFHRKGYTIHIETNGTLPVPDGVDWVTCSPKSRPWAIQPGRVDEVKVVYTGQSVQELDDIRLHFEKTKLFYLQPCSGLNIKDTVDKVLACPNWRLSLQTHKLINIQ